MVARTLICMTGAVEKELGLPASKGGVGEGAVQTADVGA